MKKVDLSGYYQHYDLSPLFDATDEEIIKTVERYGRLNIEQKPYLSGVAHPEGYDGFAERMEKLYETGKLTRHEWAFLLQGIYWMYKLPDGKVETDS